MTLTPCLTWKTDFRRRQYIHCHVFALGSHKVRIRSFSYQWSCSICSKTYMKLNCRSCISDVRRGEIIDKVHKISAAKCNVHMCDCKRLEESIRIWFTIHILQKQIASMCPEFIGNILHSVQCHTQRNSTLRLYSFGKGLWDKIYF